MFYDPLDSLTIALLTNQRGSPDPIWIALLDQAIKYKQHKPLAEVAPMPISFPNIDVNLALRETTFTVTNNGFVNDSVVIQLNYRTVVPESAFTISNNAFVLLPEESKIITVRIKPQLLATNTLYLPQAIVKIRNGIDTLSYSNTIRFRITGIQGVNSSIPLQQNFSLKQNYPNPFNPTTTIQYTLPRSGEISLKVFDVTGKEIATLENGRKNAGTYSVALDGTKFPSGIYFYQLTH